MIPDNEFEQDAVMEAFKRGSDMAMIFTKRVVEEVKACNNANEKVAFVAGAHAAVCGSFCALIGPGLFMDLAESCKKSTAFAAEAEASEARH